MEKDDRAPWWMVARRMIPWVLLQVLLRVCWLLVLAGYGRDVAAEFYHTTLGEGD